MEKLLNILVDRYGKEAIKQTLEALVDENTNYSECDDGLCDDEGCLLYKAFIKNIKQCNHNYTKNIIPNMYNEEQCIKCGDVKNDTSIELDCSTCTTNYCKGCEEFSNWELDINCM